MVWWSNSTPRLLLRVCICDGVRNDPKTHAGVINLPNGSLKNQHLTGGLFILVTGNFRESTENREIRKIREKFLHAKKIRVLW